jgi:hypothetical protein
MEARDRPTQRREWIAKAAFESALIVIGLVLAFVVNEWRDSRERNQRLHDALTSIQAELESNLASIDIVIHKNDTLIATLAESAKTGEIYQGEIIPGKDISAISSTAWDAARDAAITHDMPFSTLVVLGQAYTAQVGSLREIESFSNALYTGAVADDLRKQPIHLGGIMADFTRHTRRVRQRYEGALAVLKKR